MRLSPIEKRIILDTVYEQAGTTTRVRLFGSRLDDSRRGGDLDLLLVTDMPLPRLALAELRQALEDRLHLPVDIVAYAQGSEPSPFQAIALKQARPLDAEDAA